MGPDLAVVASRQWGLVTRAQALVAGYSDHELRRLTAGTGPWVIVRRGVYIERSLWAEQDEYVARPLMRDRAAELTIRVPHILSHDSAARSLGLPLLRPAVELVHITRPGVGGGRTEHGIKHHLSIREPPIADADGLKVTGLARTAVDIGREHGFQVGVVACDGALRRGVTRRDLEAQLTGMRNWPGISGARAAVPYADPGAESVGESLARLLVEELGVGRAETQFPVRLPGGTAWCDLRIGCHVFEFDGRVKYQRIEDGGLARRPVGEVVWEEKKRERLICAEGLGCSRIIWEDLWGAARQRAVVRLRREYAVTVTRLGVVLPPHLAEYARRVRGRRLPA